MEVEPQYEHLDFCLLIPVYNNEAGLIEALESVQYPSGAFLVVIVDDGSVQPISLTSLAPDFQKLPIHIIRSPLNKGITAALNTGLQWICENTNARYVARLDCGDRCTPDRFEEQVRFFHDHPDVGLLASWCRFENKATGQAFTYRTPLEDGPIRKAMHIRNVFIHPTVMFRTSLVREGANYPYNYPHAEDYALFWRLLLQCRGAIIGRALVTATLNSAGISAGNRHAQLESCQRVIKDFGTNAYLKNAGIVFTQIRKRIPQSLILRLKTLKERAK